MACYSYESMVRRYHIYKKIWEAFDRKVPQCKRERSNRQDPPAWLCVGEIKVKFRNKTITHEYSEIKSPTKIYTLTVCWQCFRKKLKWSEDWDSKIDWKESDLTLPNELVAVYSLEHIRVGDAHPKNVNLKGNRNGFHILIKLKDLVVTYKYVKNWCNTSHAIAEIYYINKMY